jgi:hypothetical protein
MESRQSAILSEPFARNGKFAIVHHHYRHCRLSGPIQKDWHMVKPTTRYAAKIIITGYRSQGLTSSQNGLSPPVARVVKISGERLIL